MQYQEDTNVPRIQKLVANNVMHYEEIEDLEYNWTYVIG